MDSGTFVSKNHSVGLSQYHLEWCPKYRYKSLRSVHVKEFLTQTLHEVAQEHGMAIHSVAICDDHLHLFVSIPVTMSLSKALQLLKGISTYKLFRRFKGFRMRYPKGNFWSRGSFHRSINNVTSGTIKKYIENQQHEKLNEMISSIRNEPEQLRLTDFQ